MTASPDDIAPARIAADWDRYAEGIRQRLRDPNEPPDPEAATQASMYNRCATELREALDQAAGAVSSSSPDDTAPGEEA